MLMYSVRTRPMRSATQPMMMPPMISPAARMLPMAPASAFDSAKAATSAGMVSERTNESYTSNIHPKPARPSTRQLCGVISRYQGVVAALPEPATEGAKLSATSALLLPAAILCGLSWTWMTVWHPPAERPSRPPPRQDSDQRHGSASPIPLCWMWQKRSWPPHCRSTPELDRVQAHLRHENAVSQAPMAVRRQILALSSWPGAVPA